MYKWIFFSLKSSSSLSLVWPDHCQIGLGFLRLRLFHTQAKGVSGMNCPVKRQQAQRCKQFLDKLPRAISFPRERKPLEMAGTAGAGAKHQCTGLHKVDMTLGPPVQFANPLRCV